LWSSSHAIRIEHAFTYAPARSTALSQIKAQAAPSAKPPAMVASGPIGD
jgi:hypothetical protein